MRTIRRIAIAAVCAASAGLLFAAPASADTGTSVVLGPVPLPSVPARVCVAQTPAVPSGLVPSLLSGLGLTGSGSGVTRCYSTPGAGSVTMTVDVKALTPVVAVTPPTVTRAPCPAGTSGIAGRINAGSADVRVAGSVTVTLPGGRVTTVPVGTGTIPAGKSLTLYGCSGLS